MKINKNTVVADILKEHGDLAEVMEVFGIKRVGNYGFRKFLTRFITVKTAAFVHRVPLDKFIRIIEFAIKKKER